MLDKLSTEYRNPKTMNLDQLSTLDILKIMNEEDKTVPKVIENELFNIEKAVQLVIQSFRNNGRLIYVGAGTSGRLGIIDAVECQPTFSVPQEMVQGLIAGGVKAISSPIEGAEDDKQMGNRDLCKLDLAKNDTVIGIAASGRTPYVIGALEYAKSVKANIVTLSNNKESKMSAYADVAIEIETGAEVLTGSTRLKAGTAQKMVLNMISTASMVGIGKAYQNLMVDVQPSNLKLVERSKRIIMEATGVDYETASRYFERSKHCVKTSIVMILLHCSREEARERVNKANGFVRKALKNKGG